MKIRILGKIFIKTYEISEFMNLSISLILISKYFLNSSWFTLSTNCLTVLNVISFPVSWIFLMFALIDLIKCSQGFDHRLYGRIINAKMLCLFKVLWTSNVLWIDELSIQSTTLSGKYTIASSKNWTKNLLSNVSAVPFIAKCNLLTSLLKSSYWMSGGLLNKLSWMLCFTIHKTYLHAQNIWTHRGKQW